MFKRFVLCATLFTSLGGAARADKQVQIGICVVEVGPKAFAGWVAPRLAGEGDVVLSTEEANRLIRDMKARGDASILARPSMTASGGHKCYFLAGEARRVATAVTASVDRGLVRFTHRREPIEELGMSLTFVPTVEGGSVRLKTDYRHTRLLAGSVAILPVSVVVVSADGERLAPIRQYAQMPTIVSSSIHRTYEMPADGTILADTGEVTVEDRSDPLCALVAGRPVLEWLALRVSPESFVRTKKVRRLLFLTARPTDGSPPGKK